MNTTPATVLPHAFFSSSLLIWLTVLAVTAENGDWPQWRGPTRTGYAPAGAPVPTALPKELKPLWKIAIGGGHSSPIVVGDKLIYLDDQDGQEVVHALDARNSRELWRTPFSESVEDEWGRGPRSTPFVDEDRVYAQSCRGDFVCIGLADGKVRWRTSYERDFGVKFVGSKAGEGTASRRGNNGCGVIDGDRLILPVGSTDGASLVAFHKQTGQVLWKSGHDEAAYSSFIVATLAGVKQIVAFTADALLGADPASGRILWRVPLKTNAKRHAATPVVFGGDRVMVNSHSIGLVCVRLVKDTGGLRATEAWANRDLKINLATPVLVGDHLYCQGANKDYVCADARTGALKWSQPGFGTGRKDYASTLVLGHQLLVLTEDGTLLLLAATPAKYTEIGRLQVCGNTWAFPAYSNGRLFVRDARSLLCVDLLPARTAGL
jgi:outer membrane protein assembly factor BamB